MLLVKTDLISIKEAIVAGNHRVIGDEHDLGWIKTAADPRADSLTRHRIAISRHVDQARAGDQYGALDVAIKGRLEIYFAKAIISQFSIFYADYYASL